ILLARSGPHARVLLEALLRDLRIVQPVERVLAAQHLERAVEPVVREHELERVAHAGDEAPDRLAVLLEPGARRHVELPARADDLVRVKLDGVLLLPRQELRGIDADRVARDPALLDEIEHTGREADDLSPDARTVDAAGGEEEVEL